MEGGGRGELGRDQTLLCSLYDTRTILTDSLQSLATTNQLCLLARHFYAPLALGTSHKCTLLSLLPVDHFNPVPWELPWPAKLWEKKAETSHSRDVGFSAFGLIQEFLLKRQEEDIVKKLNEEGK